MNSLFIMSKDSPGPANDAALAELVSPKLGMVLFAATTVKLGVPVIAGTSIL